MATQGLKSWAHNTDGKGYLCSADPGLLDLGALNAALGSDMLWWAKALPENRLKTMVDNSLILGLYLVEPKIQIDGNPADQAAGQGLTMIGCARLITDRVTFGYLTDVYVLKEHQQKRLGTFLMKCLNEMVEEWPELRAMWILSSSPESRRLYSDIFGTVDFSEQSTSNLALLEKKGPAITR